MSVRLELVACEQTVAPRRPLRVLRVMPHLASGGTERQCLDVLDEVRRSYAATDVEIDLALIGDRNLETITAPSWLRVHPLYAGTGPLGLWRSARRLAQLVRYHDYDCVHALLWPAAYVVALARLDRPAIASLHSTVLPYAPWRGVPDRFVFPPLRRVVFNSEAGRRRLASRLGVRDSAAMVIANGKRPYDGPWPERAGVLCPTRCMEQKRSDLLLAALHQLPRARRPSVTFVGTGTDRAPFRASLAELMPGVTGLGVVADVSQRMAGSQIVASPSDSEGSPNVVLEAWATRSCVLASDVPGVRELVVHGEDGWLVDNRPAAWADGLLRLLGDPELRRRLGESGHRRMRSEFGLGDAARRWIEVYADVAGCPIPSVVGSADKKRGGDLSSPPMRSG